MASGKRLLRDLPVGATIRLMDGSPHEFTKQDDTTIVPTRETKRKYKKYKMTLRLHMTPAALVFAVDPKYWK